jgi:hypothetical protein
MDLQVVQAFRFPNVFTARPVDDYEKIENMFIDKMDPAGSFAADALLRWAKENGHRIMVVHLQPKYMQVPYGFNVEPEEAT